MTPVSELMVIQPAWSGYFPLFTAGIAVLGALGVALIGVWSNFKGHEKTREREEEARLKREKREAGAGALAAWRDLRDRQREYAEAKEELEVSLQGALLVTHEKARDEAMRDLNRDISNDITAGRSRFRKEANQRVKDLEARLAQREPERKGAVERFEAREAAERDANKSLEQAKRQMSYAGALLKLNCGPRVIAAYAAMTANPEPGEQLAPDEAAQVSDLVRALRQEVEELGPPPAASWRSLILRLLLGEVGL